MESTCGLVYDVNEAFDDLTYIVVYYSGEIDKNAQIIDILVSTLKQTFS